MVRLSGAVACVLVALDCFTKQGRPLDLPPWAWAVCGVFWIINALALLGKGAGK
jgi:hypothetical protein